MFAVVIGGTRLEVVDGSLLGQELAAVMLSANNHLRAGSGWSLAVEQATGGRSGAYARECAALAQAAGANGLAAGAAVVTAGDALRDGDARRWVLQAITIGYRGGQMMPATPEVVYGAVRAALERAEAYQMDGVATYLMAQRPGYGATTPEQLAEALFEALVDHARGARSVKVIRVCETDAALRQRAEQACANALRARRITSSTS